MLSAAMWMIFEWPGLASGHEDGPGSRRVRGCGVFRLVRDRVGPFAWDGVPVAALRARGSSGAGSAGGGQVADLGQDVP